MELALDSYLKKKGKDYIFYMENDYLSFLENGSDFSTLGEEWFVKISSHNVGPVPFQKLILE